MLGAPGSELLRPGERQLLVERFEQDLRFFQLLCLLFNRACPIHNLDLVWVEREPSGRMGRRHLGTTEALASPWSRLLGFGSGNPHPAFCNLINDYGRHEAESCAISDREAEEVVRRTGRTHVYQCRFGLTDIAVPVVAEGRHIATLFTGQVLREPPSREAFLRIADSVADLKFVDVQRLEQAYWSVPVVSEQDIRNTTQVVEAFAEYLASSWLRLAEVVREQRRRDWENDLARKQFSYLALEGSEPDRREAAELIRKLGFSRSPNRVLVVKADKLEGNRQGAISFDLTLTAALQATEEVCHKVGNALATCLPSREVCVFFHDPPQPADCNGDLYARRLANRVLGSIRERCDLVVRIGIGSRRSGWRGLRESYKDAWTALLNSGDPIARHRKAVVSLKHFARAAQEIARLMLAHRLEEAQAQALSLFALASRIGTSAADSATTKALLRSALGSIYMAAGNLGCQGGVINALHQRALSDLDRASSFLEVYEAWHRSVSGIVQEVRLLYCGKRRKLVERACQVIEQHVESGAMPHSFSIAKVAAALGVSPGYLGRIFRQTTGRTFERFVMEKRIELSKRMLLDPVNNISQVAERCGYSDPSYFARVFRRLVGCSPSEFCANPCPAQEPTAPKAEGRVETGADLPAPSAALAAETTIEATAGRALTRPHVRRNEKQELGRTGRRPYRA